MKKYLLFTVFFATLCPAAFASGTTPKDMPPAASAAVSAPKVEVFVTSWCPYCKKLEALLKKNQIAYTRYDVESDAKGAELFEALGGTGVPVTRVGKEIIHGYDPDRVLAAIQKAS